MTFGHAITVRYGNMMKSMPANHVHSKMMAAKGAAIHSSIPTNLKSKMVHGYRTAEQSLFGSTTTLKGEPELSGLNMGQRRTVRQDTLKDINNPSPDTSQSDLAESLISRYNPQEEQ